ncbi:MAG: Segregation and condensation protein B [Anaerolinea thermophila]|uniref:Segregation and condensation protein B n=1 Tax=Anaerolinea thermophila TaxID=167964 RepID=A0A101FYN7_9CHLR|nr:MAG: Segregation and condensation protein B [Anaerolinea thermophila]
MDEARTKNKNIIEAILFISSGSIPLDQLSKFLELPTSDILSLITEMNEEYTGSHGLRIMLHNQRVQLTTDPKLALELEEFLGLEITTTLSRAALETIAIIAYKQPITRPQIDEIRGVNSDGVVRTLLSKGLIQEEGRAESIGKPILYGTTEDFLHYFGLQSIKEMPEIELISGAGGKPSTTILKQ